MHMRDTVLAVQKGKKLMLFPRIIQGIIYTEIMPIELALVLHIQIFELNLFLQKRTKEEDYVWYCFLLNTNNNIINFFLIVVRTKSKEWNVSLYPSLFPSSSLNWEHYHNSHSWILKKSNVLCMVFKFILYFSTLFHNGQSRHNVCLHNKV